MANKKCNACGKIKTVSDFHKNPAHPGGTHRYCKDCRQKETHQRYKSHKDHIKKCNSIYAYNNPLRITVIKEKWRCKVRNIEGSVTYTDWKTILERQGFRCAICYKKVKLEMDHVIPLSKGGLHIPKNIQGLCRPCNLTKGYKIMSKIKEN
jgi:5-methylcytosine-specific restriction endonuclease McrA